MPSLTETIDKIISESFRDIPVSCRNRFLPSRRTQLALINGTTTTYAYDDINRLTQLANRQTGQPANFSQYDYPSYDKVGNRLAMTVDTTQTHTYAYDNTYQLTQTIDYRPKTIDYDYDAVGNREVVTEDGTPTVYATNNMNQYESVGGVVYSYDANGNLTSDGVNSYEYDFENRLTKATTTDNIVEYKYDAFGRRIQKDIGGAITKFLYDGDQVICEYDDADVLQAKYTYGPGIDEPIQMQRGSESYYYHFDGLGSVTGITDSSGAVVENYSYDVYGNPSITSSVGNRYLFTGREYDQETWLYYYRARYYSPTIGRFLQRDPIGYYGGINLYTYVDNNPVNWVDPWGLDKKDTKRGEEPEHKPEPGDPRPKDPTPKEPTKEGYGEWPEEPGIESIPLWDDPIFYAALGAAGWAKGEFIFIGRYIGRYSRPVVIGAVSRAWHWGVRLDFPEIGKWFHTHWPWNW